MVEAAALAFFMLNSNLLIKGKMLARFSRSAFPSVSRLLRPSAAVGQPMRFFIKEQVETADSAPSTTPAKTGASKVALWEEAVAKQETALVLQDREQVEQYVLNMIRGYFRTTQKSFISMESPLEEHGLDSLDRVELIMQVEDDLGYIIDAESLDRFRKPKHFVNFIVQLEAYKREFHRLPHDDTVTDWSLDGNVPYYKEAREKVASMFKKKK